MWSAVTRYFQIHFILILFSPPLTVFGIVLNKFDNEDNLQVELCGLTTAESFSFQFIIINSIEIDWFRRIRLSRQSTLYWYLRT